MSNAETLNQPERSPKVDERASRFTRKNFREAKISSGSMFKINPLRDLFWTNPPKFFTS